MSIRKEPFVYFKDIKSVSDPQLSFNEFNSLREKIHDDADLVMFVRSYIQERTPAAFSSRPLLWESIREWFSNRCGVHPREVGLSGSAQTGFAFNSNRLGAPFCPKSSDLDLFIVNNDLFCCIKIESRRFCSSRSDKYAAQIDTIDNQIRRNMHLDLLHIPPNHDKYPTIARIKNDMSILIDRLKVHDFHLKPSHLRVYKDWECLSRWVKRSYSKKVKR